MAGHAALPLPAAALLLLLTVAPLCRTYTESEEIRYMSLRSRIHASPPLSRQGGSPLYMDSMLGREGQAPKRKNLRSRKLLQKMDKDFNPQFMSIEKPYSGQPAVHTKYTLDPAVLAQLRALNLSGFIEANKDDLTRKPDIQKVMEKWLLQRASCPVHFVWDDLGPYFWPRWVRRGFCGTDAPCSWPPGMHCVPAEAHKMFLLRWSCRRRRYKPGVGKRNRKRNPRAKRDAEAAPLPAAGAGRNARSRLRIEHPANRWHKSHRGRKESVVKCRWKKVPYPVTAECFCSC